MIGYVSASSQSLRSVLSLRLKSSFITSEIRPLVKSANPKTIVLISQPKHMLSVLKISVFNNVEICLAIFYILLSYRSNCSYKKCFRQDNYAM